ncbi:MAG: acyl-ACP--UDP-N-acetylglucosamine O-acyltransferase [Planctomycetota bacterium]
MPNIHPTSIIGPDARLAEDVEIGPFCTITGPVELASGVRVISHSCIAGRTTVGEGTVVYPNASIGFEPQDYKFKPGMETAGVRIGSGCIIREHATVHAASKPDRPTTIGDRVFLMVNSHVGHDTVVEDDVILVNNTCLAGHTYVQRNATLSGAVLLHQHGRVGRLAMCSGGSILSNDVPPFCMTANRSTLVGLNLVGLRRSGMPANEINAIKRAFREVFRINPNRTELLAMLDERAKESPCVAEMAAFVRASKRSICPVGGRRSKLRSAVEPEESAS